MLSEMKSSSAAAGSQWRLPRALQELANDGAGEVVRDILVTFQCDTNSRVMLLRAASAGSDRTALRVQAHAIKGSAMQVGADEVAAVCRILEANAAQASAAQIETLLARIETCFNEVRRAMDLGEQDQ
jgi:HPt (histidine-containing phosphotransfer) domain-containing protein